MNHQVVTNSYQLLIRMSQPGTPHENEDMKNVGFLKTPDDLGAIYGGKAYGKAMTYGKPMLIYG